MDNVAGLYRNHLALHRIITFMEARWKVPSNPARGGAFYSPWFGIESSDNLNLIQVRLPSRPHAASLLCTLKCRTAREPMDWLQLGDLQRILPVVP